MANDRPKSIAQAVREWTQFALLVFAAAWGVVTFVIKDMIIPARRPATLAITSTLEEVGRTGTTALIRARVHAVNHSDSKIYAPAFWYTARGSRLVATRPPPTGTIKPIVDRAFDPRVKPPHDAAALYSAEDTTNVVAVWRVSPDPDTWYEPADETTNEELFYVPVGTYDAIRLTVEAIGSKTIEGIARIEWTVAQDGSLAPKVLLKTHGYESDSSKVEPYDPLKNARHRRWQRQNGVGYNWAISTLSLARPGPR
jgi:hypothetical protein